MMIQITEHSDYQALMSGSRRNQLVTKLNGLALGVATANGVRISPNGVRGWFIKLEYVGGGSDKFYAGGEDQNGFFIQYGRNGTNGTRKEHPSLHSVVNKIVEKDAKGYVLVNKGYTRGHPYRLSSTLTIDEADALVNPPLPATPPPSTPSTQVPKGGGCLPPAPNLITQIDNELRPPHGTTISVNLSGINAMLTLVQAVRWDSDAQVWRGLNEANEIIMTLPSSVAQHTDWIDLETGNQIPSRGA